MNPIIMHWRMMQKQEQANTVYAIMVSFQLYVRLWLSLRWFSLKE